METTTTIEGLEHEVIKGITEKIGEYAARCKEDNEQAARQKEVQTAAQKRIQCLSKAMQDLTNCNI